MSFNRILAKQFVSTAVKDGKTVALSVATETSHWKRPDSTVAPVAEVLERSLAEYKNPLPAGTTEVAVRESNHTSPADKRDHLTVVCIKESGDSETVHIPVVNK